MIRLKKQFSYKSFFSVLRNELSTSSVKEPRPFNEIPGPKPIPVLGTLWMYWPIIGKYRWSALHHTGMKKYKTWGSLIREPVAPGVTLLWVYEPDDITTILRDEGQNFFPERRSHLALQKFREDRPHVYNSGGLLPTNGAEWWKLRSEFQKGLSAPHCARQFFKSADQITSEFCHHINEIASDCKDFLPEISRLNLELVCYMAFDTRMNSFSKEELDSHSRSSRLIKAAEDTNSCILGTDQGIGLWKFIPTLKYKKLERAQKYMERCYSS
ncbi:cytochrome P450 302a1, mitochondrial-like [Ctenocephalides felis]|uniref:cytochrome P450 302a1, mitochondrial-like n=1 Tax=Ctenocephalides felis TaxID=7515 RepID=UPI000E6E3DA5|nr:cytochrome P450 302a1, mitochondrial-like [Ctenocephalides felis]